MHKTSSMETLQGKFKRLLKLFWGNLDTYVKTRLAEAALYRARGSFRASAGLKHLARVRLS
jgi:hypothetical protein